MLFIITHQTYELWFKQLRVELESVRDIFRQSYVEDADVLYAVHLLERMNEIMQLLVRQVDIIETMTPLDFMDFRDDLVPASGFQSWQFRLLETALGLQHFGRAMPAAGYLSALKPEHRKKLEAAAHEPSLFSLIDGWLQRTPFVNFEGFDFWAAYHDAVENMLETDKALISTNPHLDAAEKDEQLARLADTHETFSVIFDESRHAELQKDGHWRLSYPALKASLLVLLYRDEPILNGPFRLLTALIELDQQMASWRQRHMQMALRMIGSKISTGGMSGGSQGYLQATINKHRIFGDFTALSTFLLPRSKLPKLPQNVQHKLGFSYRHQAS